MNQQEQMLENNKEKVVTIVKWGIILIIVILLLQECGSTWKTLLKANKPVANTTIIHHTDTIWTKDTIVVFKPIRINVPIVTTITPTQDTTQCNKIRIYTDSTSDKNITIYLKDTVQGYLLGTKPTYKLKVPLIINNTDSIKVPTLYPPTFQLQGGLVLGSQLFAPEVGVSYKRHTLGLGYNMTNKQPIIRYSFVIFRK